MIPITSAIAIVLSYVASVLGTVSGFGIATLLIPIVSLFMPLKTAIIFASLVHLFNDLWKIVFFHTGFRWSLIVQFGLPSIIAAIVGGYFFVITPTLLIQHMIGGLLVVLALLVWWQPSINQHANVPVLATGGILSGFAAGLFGIGGAIRAAFLSLFKVNLEEYLFSLGIISLFVDSTRLVVYAAGGELTEFEWWGTLVLVIPITFLGVAQAKQTLQNIKVTQLRKIIAVILIGVGAKLLFFGQ